MISIGAVGSPGDAASYYARDNYYTADEHEGASAWAGEGADVLGLSGQVDAAAFEKVLAGDLPNGSMLDAKRGEHRSGWDMTMSASKSVSLVALIGGDKRLIAAITEASRATLGWVERNLAETRVWDGQRQVPTRTGNLVAATFLHDVNRCNEPQLHVHAVIANATRAPNGKWQALRSDELYNRQRVIGAVFNAALRTRVEELGYGTTPARNPTCGAFEIAGVPRTVIEAFSTRSAEVEAYLAARGLEGTPRERELAVLATRNAKEAELAPDQRVEGWKGLAAGLGLNVRALVDAALVRSAGRNTVWTQVVRGVRGAGERGLAIAGLMGLTPRDGDPLVPERLGRLDPHAFAAAQAVASAARELGESEAAFDRLDLTRFALERGGPVTVADIEARLALLEGRGQLLGNGDRMVTTQGAVALERSYLAALEAGRGQSTPIVTVVDAAIRAQEAAQELGLRRLNLGQEAAAVLMLSSSDRVVNVQGGPGRGKSAALAPLVMIAKAEGRHVIGLAIASKKANEFGRDTGAEPGTIAGFLARHARVIDGTARPEQITRVTAELKGSIIIVEEASQVGTRDMGRIVRLANMTDARVIQTGDARQLGAISAGKPFEVSQQAGVATAYVTENLRSRSETMKAITTALDEKNLSGVFDLLNPVMTEVAVGEVAAAAAARWAALPKDERDATLLLTASRSMRAEANAAVQAELKAAGEITAVGMRVDVLDRVNSTREGARLMKGYQPGHVVEFRTNLPSQGLVRGDRGVVTGVDGNRVRLAMQGGGDKLFQPDRLAKNLGADAVSIYHIKQIEVHVGDRIRWTDNDRTRGLDNADLARVDAVGDTLIVASLVDGVVHELKPGDRMTERLDLAYAINAHIAQGITTDHGIIALRSSERRQLSERSFLVSLTRIADKIALIVDDGRKIERGVARNSGDKTSALDVVGRTGEWEVIRLPDAIERYAHLFLTVERLQVEGREPTSGMMRELATAAAMLDTVRPGGAEDLRMVLDRAFGPALTLGADAMGELRQAWAEEGKLRSDPAAYAVQFVADWQAATGALSMVQTTAEEAQAERRIERLENRMFEQPTLERALDRAIPERQLTISEPGSTGPARERDFDMDM
jgi:conjugative relaxase-like TrwC/TraI family protein